MSQSNLTSAPDSAELADPAPQPEARATTTRSMPLEVLRAYRACVNCRSRKLRCHFDSTSKSGQQSCRRCLNEERPCIIAPSSRQGRRNHKRKEIQSPSQSHSLSIPEVENVESQRGDVYHPTLLSTSEDQTLRTERLETELASLQRVGSRSTASSTRDDFQSLDIQWPAQQSEPSLSLHEAPPWPLADTGSSASRLALLGRPKIVSQDFQTKVSNSSYIGEPKDFLAGNEPARYASRSRFLQDISPSIMSTTAPNPFTNYKPFINGFMDLQQVSELFSRYEKHYHPFFPIVHRQAFDPQYLSQLSISEPHLFSAILIVASRDEPGELNVHRACYQHMRELIFDLMSGSEAKVEAVEALLLLAEWVVSSHLQQQITVAKGEEDKTAWMYVGTALRLAYFLDLDRTSFRLDPSEDDLPRVSRERLAWAACYMSDRQVSIRLGKGFWSRGPGPMIGIQAKDFPSLQPLPGEDHNHATVFQANLELTQIFSNVHDILYAARGRRWKIMLEGDYVKFIDDFRTTIRSWNNTWGSLICPLPVKTSLLLTYDYLRLYVNAFGFQATVSRAMAANRSNFREGEQTYCPLPVINAAAPDARFIYEALVAAKSLLSTLNNFVTPETCLRYMPCRYYLYIVYSAVFLYKAWSTTSMSADEKIAIKSMVNEAVDRLEKASTGPTHMGSRYANLLRMLWQKASRQRTQIGPTGSYQQENYANTSTIAEPQISTSYESGGVTQNGAFSWLDLGAVGIYATNFPVVDSSVDPSKITEEMSGSSFDIGLLTDYRWLDEDNPSLIF